jgi:hypothetical protein
LVPRDSTSPNATIAPAATLTERRVPASASPAINPTAASPNTIAMAAAVALVDTQSFHPTTKPT